MQKILIESMNHTGDGIGKIDNKVIFIKKAIPGDIIEPKDIVEHKNYLTANIKNIVKKSDKRIEAPCPYYSECGGCQIMSMNYQNQLIYKKEKVKNIFQKYANLDINPNIIASEEFYYRNKITLQVQNGTLGLLKSQSNELVEIDNCLLVTKNINKIIKNLKRNLNLMNINKIIIKDIANKIMIIFKGSINKDKVISLLKDQVNSIYLNDNCIYGQKTLVENLDKYQFHISNNSFFQVNHHQTLNLYNKVLDYLGKKEKNVLDLYCGTGTIGIYISKFCNQIMGIEINESAIKDANSNKKLNNIKNISFQCGDVSKIITSKMKYDTIIVDPPRNGLSKTTRKILKEIKSNKIIYISCNPITLTRDINALKEKYELKDITLVDMFPNTYHVECICILENI